MSTRGKRTRSSAASSSSGSGQTAAGPRGGVPHHHGSGLNGAKPKRRRTGGAAGESSVVAVVDLGKLDISTLRKYQRHYGLRTKGNKTADKEELARAVAKHFAELDVDEEETIESFVSTLMRTAA